jgi:energy-coupling factor transport system ATP-binding protein
MTIVYITNIIDEVLSADRIVILENGTITGEVKRKELFDHVDRLKEAGLEMPVIMDMLFQLKQRGVDIIVKRWSVNAVVDSFMSYIAVLKDVYDKHA